MTVTPEPPPTPDTEQSSHEDESFTEAYVDTSLLGTETKGVTPEAGHLPTTEELRGGA